MRYIDRNALHRFTEIHKGIIDGTYRTKRFSFGERVTRA